MSKKENNQPTLNDMIIASTVEEFKKGNIKSFMDVESHLNNLLGPLMQTLLDAELTNHLEYSKYEHANNDNKNYRNGYCKPKKVATKNGIIEVSTPRDRNGTFEPIIIEKGQTKLGDFEEKCISLYAKGVSVRDIEKILTDLYGVKINKDQICTMINSVSEAVTNWQNRPLKSLYTFCYADCLYIPMKEDLISEKKAVYVIIGVDMNGYKDVLGLWIDKSESATFWNGVFEDLKARGVEDILYVCSDGVAGFKGSLETVFPKTITQRCVVHLTRNLYKICPKKEANKIIQEWKKIYTSSTLEQAMLELEDFKNKFSKYTKVVEKVMDSMQYLEPLFELPDEIRKVIYTTNVVESVNCALRKVTRGKGSFPSEESVYKILYLRIGELKEKWTRTIKDWNKIQPQLITLFGDRYTKYLDI